MLTYHRIGDWECRRFDTDQNLKSLVRGFQKVGPCPMSTDCGVLEDDGEGAPSSIGTPRSPVTPLVAPASTIANREQPRWPVPSRLPPSDSTINNSSSDSSSFTPPGSPGNLSKERSVHELFRSARTSFGGSLQPGEGALAALEHPVRRGPSRMVTAQDWSTREHEPPPSPAEHEARLSTIISDSAMEGITEQVRWLMNKPVCGLSLLVEQREVYGFPPLTLLYRD